MTTLKNKIFKLSIFILLSVFLYFLFHSNNKIMLLCIEKNNDFNLISKRFTEIHSIKPKLDLMENELWDVISGFDPRNGKKIKFSEGKQYEIYKDIETIIEKYLKTSPESLSDTLERIHKPLLSLKQQIDVISKKSDQKEMMDTQEQMLGVKEEISDSKKSFADENEAIIARVKKIDKVIIDNINLYSEIEITNLNHSNIEQDSLLYQLQGNNHKMFIFAGMAFLALLLI